MSSTKRRVPPGISPDAGKTLNHCGSGAVTEDVAVKCGAVPVRVMRSGRIRNSASIARRARHAEQRNAPDAKSAHPGARRKTATQSTAFVSSTTGYRTLIGARQTRQRPRRKSQERTGTLS